MVVKYELRDYKKGKELVKILNDLGINIGIEFLSPKYPGGCRLSVSEKYNIEVELLMKMCNISYE